MNLFALKILFSKKCIVLDTLDGVTHYKVPENVHMSEIFSDITHSRRVLVKTARACNGSLGARTPERPG